MCLYSIDVLEKLSLTNMLVLFSLILNSIFWPRDVESLFNNVTMKVDPSSRHSKLPALPNSEEVCTAGQTYRFYCNTCICEQNNVLLCTKMGCLDSEALGAQQSTDIKSDKHKIIRRSNPNGYPELPDGECVPGQIYSKMCNYCFCEKDKKAICATKSCQQTLKMRPIEAPEDVRPAFSDVEFDQLPSLPNSASKCDAGLSYRVDCNSCLCLADGNLLCGKMLCISLYDMNRLNANKKSGGQCQGNEKFKIDCMKCVCVEGSLDCEAIENCVTMKTRRLLRGSVGYRRGYQPNDVKCLPGVIYKMDCNKCYCQADSSLRCTNKRCLNYVQAIKIQRHRLFLEKQSY